MIWHSSDKSEVLKELSVDPKKGLGGDEVLARIKKYGENRLVTKKRSLYKEVTKRLLRPVNAALVILSVILTITGAIEGLKLWLAPITVLFIVVLAAFLGGLMAIRNERLMQTLKDKVLISAKVLRGGEVSRVDSAGLVPGDIVYLEQGDFIPADGRLLEENALICDESAITGDSAPIEKSSTGSFNDICPIAERSNMVYLGCSVTFGHATMVVTDTGKFTELGKMNQIKEQTVGTETPLKKYLRDLGKTLSIALLVTALVLFVLGVILVKPSEGQVFSDLVLSMLTLSLSLYAVSVNTTLPRFVTSATSFSAFGMLERNAVLRNPEKIETLSKVSVIISDKTGTLTRNKMTMTSFFDGQRLIDLNNEEPDEKAITVIRTGALCCDGTIIQNSNLKPKEIGDATEVGIVAALSKYAGLSKSELENIYPRMAEVPFDSDRKLMTTVNMINNRPFAVVKGAPEALFKGVTSGSLEVWSAAAVKMGEAGERVIAVAIKPLEEVPSNPTAEELECGLTLLGLFGMSDSISTSTRRALSEAESAGIRTVMVTGDQIATATTIAKDLGILKEGQVAITAKQLSQMSDEELCQRVREISVYCGINDSDKVRIVKAFKEAGETVCVTGDSVLDAEALRLADIGAAMGQTGKDIAKGAADLVVTDDSFISILQAVKTARNNFFNIRHAVQFLFATLLAEVVSLLFGFIIFKSAVFTAQGLLLINTALVLMLGRALAGEPDRKNSMFLPPRGKKEGIFSSLSDFDFVWQGVLLSVLTLISFGANKGASPLGAAFATFGFGLVLLTFALRICSSIYHEGFKVGRNMLTGTLLSALTVLVVLITPISYLFGLSGIKVGNIFAALGFGLLLFAVYEAVKFLRKFLKERK